MQDVEEPEARAAFIWILGEHGHAIQVDSDTHCCVISMHSHAHLVPASIGAREDCTYALHAKLYIPDKLQKCCPTRID